MVVDQWLYIVVLLEKFIAAFLKAKDK